jgi:tRNA A37 threonylcarbamoyladenosine synthetase subunit TsaC/SUA5/YrdC
MTKNIFLLPTDTCFGIACALDDMASYHRIYKIKKRKLGKPLALMVEDWVWLEKYTKLTLEQIEELKNYKKPFTILTDAPYIKMFINLEDENDEVFENAEVYEEIAFRVAHNDTQRKLIKEIGPIWLTSANFSGEAEIYDSETLEKVFERYLEEIKILAPKKGNYVLEKNPPSDIFRFLPDGSKEYTRKS